MSERIALDHGSGGRRSRELIRTVFQSRLGNSDLDAETDAAIVSLAGDRVPAGDVPLAGDVLLACDVLVATTTDAHVVKPLVFPGGDIGRLAVCGTVNDLAVSGADPRYLTASFIIEEGFAISELESIVDSMASAATEAGVSVVAGDTKVVEHGACDGLFITTSGVGSVPVHRREIASARHVQKGDLILVNGPIGDHGAVIACVRNEIETDPPLLSDCAPLSGLIRCIYDAGVTPHFMRDATRGGLATVLCELSEMCSLGIRIREEAVPVRDAVRGVCELYGFDPLYLANEGTMICVVNPADADAAIKAMAAHPYGRDAVIVGEVVDGERATIATAIGGNRILRMLAGEQLPRIC